MAELNSGLDAGDETRRHGDYIGFPHTESDGTSIDSIAGPVEGEPVGLDANGDIQFQDLPGDGTGGAVLGVLYTYPYYGETTHNGPFVRGDQDATVKTGGSVVMDFTNVTAAPSAGDTLGPNGELLVLTDPDADNLAEVRVR